MKEKQIIKFEYVLKYSWDSKTKTLVVDYEDDNDKPQRFTRKYEDHSGVSLKYSSHPDNSYRGKLTFIYNH